MHAVHKIQIKGAASGEAGKAGAGAGAGAERHILPATSTRFDTLQQAKSHPKGDVKARSSSLLLNGQGWCGDGGAVVVWGFWADSCSVMWAFRLCLLHPSIPLGPVQCNQEQLLQLY